MIKKACAYRKCRWKMRENEKNRQEQKEEEEEEEDNRSVVEPCTMCFSNVHKECASQVDVSANAPGPFCSHICRTEYLRMKMRSTTSFILKQVDLMVIYKQVLSIQPFGPLSRDRWMKIATFFSEHNGGKERTWEQIRNEFHRRMTYFVSYKKKFGVNLEDTTTKESYALDRVLREIYLSRQQDNINVMPKPTTTTTTTSSSTKLHRHKQSADKNRPKRTRSSENHELREKRLRITSTNEDDIELFHLILRFQPWKGMHGKNSRAQTDECWMKITDHWTPSCGTKVPHDVVYRRFTKKMKEFVERTKLGCEDIDQDYEDMCIGEKENEPYSEYDDLLRKIYKARLMDEKENSQALRDFTASQRQVLVQNEVGSGGVMTSESIQRRRRRRVYIEEEKKEEDEEEGEEEEEEVNRIDRRKRRISTSRPDDRLVDSHMVEEVNRIDRRKRRISTSRPDDRLVDSHMVETSPLTASTNAPPPSSASDLSKVDLKMEELNFQKQKWQEERDLRQQELDIQRFVHEKDYKMRQKEIETNGKIRAMELEIRQKEIEFMKVQLEFETKRRKEEFQLLLATISQVFDR